MDMDLDFTYSTSFGDLPGLVSNLHDHSQKYVLIVVSEKNLCEALILVRTQLFVVRFVGSNRTIAIDMK